MFRATCIVRHKVISAPSTSRCYQAAFSLTSCRRRNGRSSRPSSGGLKIIRTPGRQKAMEQGDINPSPEPIEIVHDGNEKMYLTTPLMKGWKMQKYFNPELPYIAVPFPGGRFLYRNIKPTPRANVDLLKERLVTLLRPPERPEGQAVYRRITFGETAWQLSPHGDMIHRSLAIADDRDVKEILDQITSIADTMKHHPHVCHRETGTKDNDSAKHHITVSCATHKPPGLGMRDVKLAEELNLLLARYNISAPLPYNPDLKDRKEEVRRLKREQVGWNYVEIRKAREAFNKPSSDETVKVEAGPETDTTTTSGG